MGTYSKIVLKRKNQAGVVNNLLKEMGAEMENFNGVEYGLFFTQKMVDEDIRFMNEDEEGLKQATHLKRPITEKSYFGLVGVWRQVGQLSLKISCPNNVELDLIPILKDFIQSDNGRKYINFDKSEYIDRIVKF